MPDRAPLHLRFGPFLLEEADARLSRDGRAIELVPKAFGVLCHLAARPGRLVTKDELLDAVWGHRHISESVLKSAVKTIRASLGGPRAHHDTHRLLAQVEVLAERSGAPYDRAWLDVCRGVVAYFDARFADVVTLTDAADRRFADHCIGVDWEVGQCRGFALTALAWQGNLTALARRHRRAPAVVPRPQGSPPRYLGG